LLFPVSAFLLNSAHWKRFRKFSKNTQSISIRTAIDKQKHEIQIILTNYKNEHIGFADPAEKLKL